MTNPYRTPDALPSEDRVKRPGPVLAAIGVAGWIIGPLWLIAMLGAAAASFVHDCNRPCSDRSHGCECTCGTERDER